MSISSGSAAYNFKRFINDVYDFNSIRHLASGKEEVTLNDLRSQYKVILEEVKETGEAIDNADLVKILDGVVDTLVTTLGMAQQLEKLGINVLGACQKVADDNLTKFPESQLDADATVMYYHLHNVPVNSYEVNWMNQKYYVILDENNKVRKPVNFKGTKLDAYVPSSAKVE